MNQPVSNHLVATPDQVAKPSPMVTAMRWIELHDACGNGYTAADLARALAVKGRAAGSAERA